MLRIIKGSEITSNEAPVVIPDAVIVKRRSTETEEKLDSLDIDFSKYDEADVKKLEEYFEHKKKHLLFSANEEIESLEEQAQTIVSDAQTKADELEKDAQFRAEGIIENAKNLAEDIYAEAKKGGRADGIKEVNDRVNDYFEEIWKVIEHIKEEQEKAYDEVYERLRFLVLDVAEKITFRKIEDNDAYLCELVSNKLRDMKDAEWVTVTVSEKMSGLVAKLREIQLQGKIQKNADFAADNSPLGTVKLESNERIIDASVVTQLSNIKKYFETYGEIHDEK